jgi:hypothetical protein
MNSVNKLIIDKAKQSKNTSFNTRNIIENETEINKSFVNALASKNF